MISEAAPFIGAAIILEAVDSRESKSAKTNPLFGTAE
jgi:hypothetical protein